MLARARWLLRARQLAAHGTPTFVYRVTEPHYTSHGGDNPLWNGVPKWRPTVAMSAVRADAVASAEQPLLPMGSLGDAAHSPSSPRGRAAMSYLAQFARHGDPNGALAPSGVPLPHWEPHVAGAAQFMELGPRLGMGSAPDAALEQARFALVAEYLSSLPKRGQAGQGQQQSIEHISAL